MLLKSIPDVDLLREMKRGDEAAAAKLYERYALRLTRLTEKNTGADLANRFDPDDILQSVFGSFFKKARDGFYDVPSEGDLWPLLLVIALRKIRTYGTRHRAARRDVRREHPQAVGDRGNGDLERMESREPEPFIRLLAKETLELLPPAYRSIVLWRLDGYELAEIARLAGRSKRSIERIFQECRQILQHKHLDCSHGNDD